MIDLLRDRTGLTTESDSLAVCGHSFPVHVEKGNAEEPEAIKATTRSPHGRFGSPRAAAAVTRTPWRRSPSGLITEDATTLDDLATFTLGPGIADNGAGSATDRGTAWHLAFRVLAHRPDLAGRIARTTGLRETTLDEIAGQARRLIDWLATRGYDRLHFEIPLQEVAADGSETNAVLDCLAEGAAGLLILDHKSGPCPDPAARFVTYRPQLMAYAAMVRAKWPDKSLSGVAINWMNEGTVSLSQLT